MKFGSGGGSNDTGSQMREESFYLQRLWSQGHGEIDFSPSSHHLTLEAVTAVGGSQQIRDTAALPF